WTGPTSFASSSVTAARSRSVRIPIAPPRSSTSPSHYTGAVGSTARSVAVSAGALGGRPSPPGVSDQARQGLAHLVERPLDGIPRGGVGEAQVAFPELAEGGPPQDGDPALLQEVGRDLLRGPPEALDVGEDVERAPRPGARDAGQPAQAVDDQAAAPAELLDHGLHLP